MLDRFNSVVILALFVMSTCYFNLHLNSWLFIVVFVCDWFDSVCLMCL